MKISERLQMLRKQNGLSQEDLAQKLHVTRQAVSKWENGQSSPDLDNVIAMCELYGVTADYILRGQEMKQENPSAGQNNKNRTTVFGILTGAGAILLCLLPLFARLYQTMEMRTWNQANTFAARYLVEFPLLGILLMALGLLAAGLAGMIRIRCMGKHES